MSELSGIVSVLLIVAAFATSCGPEASKREPASVAPIFSP